MALQEEDSPGTEVPLKRDRSFSEQDLAQLQSQLGGGQAVPQEPEPLQPEPRPRSGTSWRSPAPHRPWSPVPRVAGGAPGSRTCHGLPVPPCRLRPRQLPPAAGPLGTAPGCPRRRGGEAGGRIRRCPQHQLQAPLAGECRQRGWPGLGTPELGTPCEHSHGHTAAQHEGTRWLGGSPWPLRSLYTGWGA